MNSSPVMSLHDCDVSFFLVALNDYTALSQTITLDSVSTSVNLMIDIIDDVLCEPDERFEIVLTSMNDNCVVTSSPVLVLIIDNDGESPVNNPLLCYMFDAYCVCVLQLRMLAPTRPATQYLKMLDN